MRSWRGPTIVAAGALAALGVFAACVSDEGPGLFFSDGGSDGSSPTGLTFNGSAIALSSACGTAASPQVVSLTNNTQAPITWSAALAKSPSPFTIDDTGGTIPPGGSATITIGIGAFDAGSAATATDKLTITTATGDTVINLSVSANGPALVVTPASLDLGSTPYRGTSAPMPVTIQNVGSAPASVMLGVASPFAASVTGAQTIMPDASLITYVIASPSAEGGIAGSLTIQVQPPTVLCGAAPGNVPLAATGVNGPIMIAESVRNVCVVKSDSTVYCWGNNSNAAIGNGTPSNNTVSYGTPQEVVGIADGGFIASIATGYQYACVSFAPKGLACWGADYAGQSGDPNFVPLTSATYYDGSIGLSEIAQVATGTDTTYLRNAGGLLYCMGDNSSGLFGADPSVPIDDAGDIGGTTIATLCPQGPGGTIFGSSTANDIIVQSGRACATLNTGVTCWPNAYLPDGGSYLGYDASTFVAVLDDDAGSWSPGPILDPSGNPLRSKQLASGAAHVCALQPTGEVFCFGDNTFGQLGDGTGITSENRAVRAQGITDAVAIGAGTYFTCAVHANGSVSCWGDNGHGQLANNTTTPTTSPTSATAITMPVVALTSCDTGLCDFMCAITQGAEVWCWGTNTYLQLGQGTTGPGESHVPLRVQGF